MGSLETHAAGIAAVAAEGFNPSWVRLKRIDFAYPLRSSESFNPSWVRLKHLIDELQRTVERLQPLMGSFETLIQRHKTLARLMLQPLMGSFETIQNTLVLEHVMPLLPCVYPSTYNSIVFVGG